ncbi:sentrin sumo-specific protease [Chrysochromulina tobinii]|uniref:Sentrin sumo-specific protease n=1 Tax=Chrysochromulina tobinii TaxID=1460289 RepID=A0A0M0JRQ9_9EUKA|nr:sentrin sumo-specific protease [Chrysochromulina tobinii]|eukprot:KOO28947.1 sentrin sumo-specific protease [Chrysochromulina sp. CCMP291]
MVFEDNFNLCGHFGDGLGHWAAIAVYIGCNSDYMSVWKLDSIREPILLSDPKKPPDRIAASKLAESAAAVKSATVKEEVTLDSSEEVKPPGKRAYTLPTLTTAEAEIVDEALGTGNPNEILAELRNIPISRLDMTTLRPGQWLNDEVINYYFKILEQREASKATGPSCHFHQTTFYPKLAEGLNGYQYSQVAEWTRGKDVFSKDLIIVPIHQPGHWTLAVINMKQKRFEYYDSLRGPPDMVLTNLRRWLEDESLDKKKVPFDTSGWTEVVWKQGQTPQQRNGWDCGMFMIRTADYIARDTVLSFTQEDMELFRRLTVLEILKTSDTVRSPKQACKPTTMRIMADVSDSEEEEQRRTEGWQPGDEKLQAATVNGVIETIMSETLKSERDIMSETLWEAAVALQSSLGADPHVPPQLLLVPSVDGVAKLGGNGGKADGRLVIFLVLGTTKNPAWTANNQNYKFLGKMRVDPHASKRSKGTCVKVCGGLFVLKGFEYDTESKQVIQIAFLQDGKPRMAFIAEKSPLLSMSMTEGVFSTFPKDEEIIKILRKCVLETIAAEAEQRAEADRLKKETLKSMKKIKKSEEQRRR